MWTSCLTQSMSSNSESPLGEEIIDLCREAIDDFTLVAPFITMGGLVPLLEALPEKIAPVVYTRWLPADVCSGVSDPRVFHLIAARGGSVLLNDQLHAKAYISGNRALIGSANVTSTGLGWAAKPNIEVIVETTNDDPNVQRLLDELDASRLASPDEAASAIELAKMSSGSEPNSRDPSPVWLPKHPVPMNVVAAYLGTTTPVDKQHLAEDLELLAPPGGLDEAGIRRYITLSMQTGLMGAVGRECQHHNLFIAVRKLERLCADAELDLGDEDVLRQWNKCKNWRVEFPL